MRRTHIVQQIREALKKVAPTAQAILYGSEARGDARPDSDIDLLVLVEGDKVSVEEELRITAPLYDIELNTGISVSTRILPRQIWENRPFKTPFYINIMNEGIIL